MNTASFSQAAADSLPSGSGHQDCSFCPPGMPPTDALFRLADCEAAGTLKATVTEPDLTRPLQNITKESSS
jgi:hypothetical protein